jgi:hypothetical protein
VVTPSDFLDLVTHARGSSTINCDSAYKIVASAASVTATWSIPAASGGDTGLSAIATFKAAAAADTTLNYYPRGGVTVSGYRVSRGFLDTGGG